MRSTKKLANIILVFILMLDTIQIPQTFTKKEMHNIKSAPSAMRNDFKVFKADMKNLKDQICLYISQKLEGIENPKAIRERRKQNNEQSISL